MPDNSSSSPIVIVTKWQARTGALASVLTLSDELRRLSLMEPGCLGYEIFRGVGDSSDLLLLERYADGGALQAHRCTAHYERLVVRQILPMLSLRRVELLQAVALP